MQEDQYYLEQILSREDYFNGMELSFQVFSNIWLEQHGNYQLRITTLKSYQHIIANYLIPEFGSLKIAKIQPLHIQIFYNKLQKVRRMDNRSGTLSNSTIKKIHNVLSSILSSAVRWQIIENNPCNRVFLPRHQHTTKTKYFTLEQTQIFLELLEHSYSVSYRAHDRMDDTGKLYHVREYKERHSIPTQQKIFFYIALFGGLRRGEIIALTWDDIKFEESYICITKSTIRVNGTQRQDATKNYSSIRNVTLPISLMAMLKQYKIEQERYRFLLGDQWEGENYLFIQQNGKQMSLDTPYHTFKKIIKRYNESVLDTNRKLPDIPLHGLRHTSATLLVSQNIDIQTISYRLGHAQTSTTMNIYSHSLQQMDRAAANQLETLIKINGLK